MYTIAKKFSFDASHVLLGLPAGHKCGRFHGHTYTVEVILKSINLDEHGFVIDYGELSDLKEIIDDKLDHRHLNDVFPFNPTAENIAKHLYGVCKALWKETYAVRVSETPNTWAEYVG